ncbi:MAG: hypothetical protein JXR96_07890 [Deltaproteobacteria bacterium]|nr:hypothetical protein [Deltaproteobacteria bacterium]
MKSVLAPCLAGLIGLGALGCPSDRPADLCIASDLGRYRLRAVQRTPDGCRAVYADPRGREARVEVSAYRPGLLADAGMTAPFEKHVVFARSDAERVQLGWFGAGRKVAVRLELDGFDQPAGPVLRAYLFRHPSAVVSERLAVEQDVEALRSASRTSPRKASLHLDLARNYRKLGNTVMAAHEYHICIEIDPQSYDCLLELGILYRKLGHWDLSIRALLRSAAARPAAVEPRLQLGDVYYFCHNREGALDAYRRALSLGISDPKDRQRAADRAAELEAGKFAGEVLPGQKKLPGQ